MTYHGRRQRVSASNRTDLSALASTQRTRFSSRPTASPRIHLAEFRIYEVRKSMKNWASISSFLLEYDRSGKLKDRITL